MVLLTNLLFEHKLGHVGWVDTYPPSYPEQSECQAQYALFLHEELNYETTLQHWDCHIIRWELSKEM